MNDRIRHLLSQMAAIEDELNAALHEHESPLSFRIKGRRIKFERSIREAHAKLQVGVFRWLFGNRPQNLITGPVIYSMIIPLVILDLFVTFYQASCFPIYGISRVHRSDYIVFDRHHLGYLNFIEKFHCNYCAYGRGLIAYTAEIVARTESYFCPIKHASRVLGTHSRYVQFLDFGEAADYEAKLEKFRASLAEPE